MKRLVMVAALAALAAAWSFAAEDGAEPAKKENARLAAQLLVNGLREKAKGRQVDPESLYAQMNADKSGHAETEKSRALCRQAAEKSLREFYATEARRVLDRLIKVGRPEGVADWFTADERNGLLSLPDSDVKQSIDSGIGQAFGKAREKSCSEQWEKLARDVFPTESEFESAERSMLRRSLTERLVAKHPEAVFQENSARLGSEWADNVLNEAEQQRKSQQQVVSGSSGGPALEPSGIAQAIGKDIASFRDSMKGKAGKVYDIFPSVRQSIPTRASDVAGQKLSAGLSKMQARVPKDDVKQFISKELEKHAGKEASWGLCQSAFSQAIRSKSVDAYVSEAPAEGREALRQFVEGALRGNASCGNAMDGLVERSLKPAFEEARSDITADQVAENFGPLSAGSWRPADEEIYSQQNRTSVSVTNPLSMPGISSKPFDRARLLEETVDSVRGAVERAVSEGVAALRAQMAAVERAEPQVRSDLRRMASVPDIDSLVSSFMDKVVAAWSGARHGSRYESLFQRVQDDVRRRAKDMLPLEIVRRHMIEEEKKKEEARPQVAEAPSPPDVISTPSRGSGTPDSGAGTKGSGGGESAGKGKQGGGAGNGSGGGGTGGGSGPGSGDETGKGKLIPDMIIDVDHNGAAMDINFLFPRSGRSQISIELPAGQYVLGPMVSGNIQSIMAAWLENSARNANQGDGEVRLFVVTRVFDAKVCYGVVYGLRECLEAALAKVGNKKIKVCWYDQLIKGKGEKGKQEVPQEFRQKGMMIVV